MRSLLWKGSEYMSNLLLTNIGMLVTPLGYGAKRV